MKDNCEACEPIFRRSPAPASEIVPRPDGDGNVCGECYTEYLKELAKDLFPKKYIKK